MYPMSLYESGESNGKISLSDLFKNKELPDDCMSDLTIDEIIMAACRGGWPSIMNKKLIGQNLWFPAVILTACAEMISAMLIM